MAVGLARGLTRGTAVLVGVSASALTVTMGDGARVCVAGTGGSVGSISGVGVSARMLAMVAVAAGVGVFVLPKGNAVPRKPLPLTIEKPTNSNAAQVTPMRYIPHPTRAYSKGRRFVALPAAPPAAGKGMELVGVRKPGAGGTAACGDWGAGGRGSGELVPCSILPQRLQNLALARFCIRQLGQVIIMALEAGNAEHNSDKLSLHHNRGLPD